MAAYSFALLPLLALVFVTWLVSVRLRDVSIVDPVWSLLFLTAAWTWWFDAGGPEHPRVWIVMALVAAWAIRLCVYLTIRKWGEPEDHRYAEMREHRGQKFWWLSLFTVFCLQAMLAWVVAAPIFAVVAEPGGAPPIGPIDVAGIVTWVVGFVFQVVGDAQLARFKSDPANRGKVLDSGLWRYTRHPNYFGEFCMWWGLWLLALAAGGAWSMFGPLLMSFLLLRVSGVTLLEKTITERRPGYREYVARTNAFFPGRPRNV